MLGKAIFQSYAYMGGAGVVLGLLSYGAYQAYQTHTSEKGLTMRAVLFDFAFPISTAAAFWWVGTPISVVCAATALGSAASYLMGDVRRGITNEKYNSLVSAYNDLVRQADLQKKL